jgi:hypothetical protein
MPFEPVLSQTNPLHTFITYFSKIDFYFIFLSNLNGLQETKKEIKLSWQRWELLAF